MKKSYKYKLVSNKTTFNNADKWVNLCRYLYNAGLEERIIAYKQHNTKLSQYTQQNELPELKKYYPEFRFVNSQTLCDVMFRLNNSYNQFYRRIKKGNVNAGFPRYKSKNRYNSFTLTQSGWKLKGKYLYITHIGRFKIKLSRMIIGTVKTVTVIKEASGKWYACFSCDNVPERKLPESDTMVGIDVGIKSFLIDSDDNKIDNPKYFRNSKKLLRRRQRNLARCIRSSNRRHKVRILVAKAHGKIKNQRNDFLHKTANYYIKNYGFIAIEDLNIKGMVKNHNLSKSISDASWGKFFELLSYKAEEAGRIVVKVPRFEPTSKTCSSCGAIKQDLTLNDRQWVCQSCGTLHDRDFNAAKNILKVGQTLQSLTCADTQSVDCESLKSECQYGV